MDAVVFVFVFVAVVFAVALPLLGPHKAVAVEPAGKTRLGDAHGCASFSTGQGCPVEKSRWRNEPRPQRGRGAQAGVCFLLVTFLCTSKEK